MPSKYVVLLIGGLIPAFLLGVGGVLQKLACQTPLGTGPFLILTGSATCLVGTVFLLIERDFSASPPSILLTVLYGLFWASSTGMITIALRRLGGSISQLAPLYNMNTLVAVLIGLTLLAEWKTVQPLRISVAAVLIVLGGIVAAKS